MIGSRVIVQYEFQNDAFPPMFKNKLLAHALGGYNGHTYLNTREAFENALKNGYLYFEVDLKLTTDGKLVCWHGRSKRSSKKTGVLGFLNLSI